MKKLIFYSVILFSLITGCENISEKNFFRENHNHSSRDSTSQQCLSKYTKPNIEDSLRCIITNIDTTDISSDTIAIYKTYEDEWWGILSDEEWLSMRKKQILIDKKEGKTLEWVKVHYVDYIVKYDSIIKWWNNTTCTNVKLND